MPTPLPTQGCAKRCLSRLTCAILSMIISWRLLQHVQQKGNSLLSCASQVVGVELIATRKVCDSWADRDTSGKTLQRYIRGKS